MSLNELVKKLRISNNVETISIWSFFKIEETKDLSYLNVDYDEFSESNPKLEGKKYDEIWEKIYNEYCILNKDGERELYFKKELELSGLKIKRHIVLNLKWNYENSIFSDEAFEDMLSKWDVRVSKDKQENIHSVDSFISIIDKMIKIKEDDIRDSVKNKNDFSVYDLKLILETNLSKNDIDIKNTSMKYFITMINSLKSKK